MKKAKFLFAALLAASIMPNLHAATVTEDFEDVTITDADSYGRSTTLSNGWVVVGGYIANSYDTYNYGLWSKAYNESSKSLTAQAGSNTALVVIPQELSGSFSFYARKSSTSSTSTGYLDIYEVVKDGETYKKASATAIKSFTFSSTTWTQYTVDLGEGPRMVAINMVRSAIDDVEFNTYEAPTTPRMSVLQSGVKVATGGTYNFGLQSEAATVQYSIKNIGAGTLSATLSCTGAYTVSPAKVSVAAGQEQVVTITQKATSFGAVSGTLTISAANHDPWTLSLAGIVRDPAKLYYDFNETPAGWTFDEDKYWKVAEGCLSINTGSYYGVSRVVSPALTITSSDVLYLRYKGTSTSSYYQSELHVWTSIDGIDWKELGTGYTVANGDKDWKEATISGFPANANFISFTGRYVAIDDFYGFSPISKPIMAVVMPNSVLKDDDDNAYDDFKNVISTATHTYTVKNVGVGSLTVTIKLDGINNYSVSQSTLTIAAGEAKTFDLTFTADDAEGNRTNTLTIQPNNGIAAVTVELKAVSAPYENIKYNISKLDLNGDGEVNIGDVTRFAKYLLK